MAYRHKRILYGLIVVCMILAGVFGTGNILRDGTRTGNSGGSETASAGDAKPQGTAADGTGAADAVTTESDTGRQTVTVLDTRIEERIAQMTLTEKVGQMFFVKNDGRFGPDELTQYPVGGILLFAGDLAGETGESLTEKLQTFQDASEIPLLIGTDEEGGTVTRVSQYASLADQTFASPRELYASGGFSAIQEDTEEKSDLLLAYGINVNFAPVCDLSGDPDDFIYARTFSDNPQDTAEYVSLVVGIMREKKIGTVLKHFPGYGSNGDTHVNQVEDTRTYDEFLTRDYIPFEAGIDAGADCVLVSHNVVSAIDDTYPASLSEQVHQELREVLGFEGVIITDDLMMNGVSSGYDTEEAAVQAVLAGNDMLLSTDYREQMDAVIAAVEDGTISEERIDESVARILKWKSALGLQVFE